MTENRFVSRIREILEYNTQLRKDECATSGKVSTKRLGRYPSPRLFIKESDRNHQDKKFYISLLVDSSGSIFNHDLRESVVQAMTTITSALTQINEISYEVVLFSQGDFIFKEYNSKWNLGKFNQIYQSDLLFHLQVSVEPLFNTLIDTIQHIKQFGNFSSDNNDALSIYRCLERNKEKNHIVIVLSDGKPTGSSSIRCKLNSQNVTTLRGSKEEYRLAKAVSSSEAVLNLKKLLKKTKTPVIGIGVQTGYGKEMYPYWTTAKDETEMFQGIVKHLSKLIKKYAD